MTTDTKEELPKLQRRHRRFCDHYLTGLTGSGAYKKLNPDVSDDTAKHMAHRILKRPEVKAYLEERRQNLSEATGITAEMIVRELGLLAFGNLKRLFNEDGTLIPIHQLPDDVAAMLAGFDVEALYDGSGKERTRVGDVLKFKAAGKRDALETLAKLLGFMKEKVEFSEAAPPVIQLVPYEDDAGDTVPTKSPAA